METLNRKITWFLYLVIYLFVYLFMLDSLPGILTMRVDLINLLIFCFYAVVFVFGMWSSDETCFYWSLLYRVGIVQGGFSIKNVIVLFNRKSNKHSNSFLIRTLPQFVCLNSWSFLVGLMLYCFLCSCIYFYSSLFALGLFAVCVYESGHWSHRHDVFYVWHNIMFRGPQCNVL